MITLWVLGVLSLTLIVKRINAILNDRKLPEGTKEIPGPKGYPFIGSVLDLPKTHTWLKFKEWANVYGPIYKVNILGNTLVILSNQEMANDLLSMRGAIYSDRPQLNMAQLVTHGGNFVASGSNDYWRRARRFSQAMLSPMTIRRWASRQTLEARRTIVDVANEPNKYDYLFERFSTLVSLRQIFGKNVTSGEDEVAHVHRIQTIMRTLERVGSPGAYMVDLIPALKYLPKLLAPFKREAESLYQYESSYYFNLLHEQRVKFESKLPETPASFARSFLEDTKHWEFSEFEAAFVIGTIYGAGSGTTSVVMQSYCLAMLHYPDWQAKLQNQIEDVVGGERPPTLEDIPNLPLVRAIVKEILRWRPVVTGGLPHRLIQDDVYKGYFLPKGAIIHPNQWAIHRDPQLYPDPESFHPERWLDPTYPTYREPLTQYPNLKRYSAFGFGRRVCPGLDSAEQALYIGISNLAWACSIRLKKDANGKDIPVPWYDYLPGLNSPPAKFSFDVEPVSQTRIELLRNSIVDEVKVD